jgi:hypothetical protein
MAALIKGCLHINPYDLTEDEFFAAWGESKYLAQVLYQTEFK